MSTIRALTRLHSTNECKSRVNRSLTKLTQFEVKVNYLRLLSLALECMALPDFRFAGFVCMDRYTFFKSPLNIIIVTRNNAVIASGYFIARRCYTIVNRAKNKVSLFTSKISNICLVFFKLLHQFKQLIIIIN